MEKPQCGSGKETGMERHIDILEKQEQMLRFDHFTHKDILNLGLFMVDRAQRLGTCVSVAVRTAEGAAVFQHLPDGTGKNNENWMRRKANTVLLMDCSSLRAAYNLERYHETLEDHGLSHADYALCGGGFPARLKDGTLVGVVTVSNLYHIADHEFVTQSLREYLNCPECPEYPYTIPE